MGLRKQAYVIGAFLAFCSSVASALGLGEIRLNSALNQPLDAEIQLLHVRDLTEREILIGVASAEEFARAGVDRNFFISDLKFYLDLSAPKGPVVRVTSKEPVREPFLNFIVAARWPSGRLLREYTLLVDLPVFTGNRAGAVEAATQPEAAAPRPVAERAERPQEVVQRSTPSEAQAPSNTFSGDSYGPVGANETLWAIASRVKPDGSVSVQQTMLAIQRLNPGAFINGNINRLRRGQVLRIPDKEEIQQLTTRDAQQQVAEQNRSWSKRSPATEGAQLEGSKNVAPTRSDATPVEGRVKLSTANSGAQTGGGTGADEAREGGQVSETLAQAQEELDAADRENSDLKSRIQSMEEQIQTMERLVEVSNEEMRALELAAQQANQPTESTPSAETASADSEQPQTPIEQVQQPAEQPAAEPTPTPVTPPPVRQKSWMDLLMDNILYVGVLLGALLLGLVAFLMRKRKDNDDDFDDFASNSSDELNLEDTSAMDSDQTVPFHKSDDVELPEEEHVVAEAETEDVVGECDIHIAYAQYDLAEEKLLRALDKDPANSLVRLKLLEVFAEQGDANNFDYHYAQLRAMGDTEAVERAAVIRGTMEGIDDFDPAFYDTSDTTLVTNKPSRTVGDHADDLRDDNFGDALEFDFNDVDDLVGSSKPEAQTDTLDFDLTLDEEDVADVGSTNEVRQERVDELADLDFDLGDLEAETRNFDDLSFATEEGQDGAAKAGQDDVDLDFADSAVSDDPKFETENVDTDFADLNFDDDRLTDEFADNLVAERPTAKQEEEFDFAGLDVDNIDEGSELGLAEDDLDFDLERDLQEAQLEEQAPAVSADQDHIAGVDLDDLEELDVDATSERAPAVVATSTADNSADFDMDFDLDREVNLDELDQELDVLAADFGSSRPMEEPELDFDDLEDVKTEEFSPEEQDLDDLLMESSVKPENRMPELSVNRAPPVEAANSGLDFEIPDFDPENDDDSNLDFLSDNDETATKLDLARAYIDMGDSDGAKDILDEIMDEGSDQQKKEAEALLARIG